VTPFVFALNHVLGAEGGFVNNPSDRGGATNMGITLRTLATFRKSQVTVEDVKALTRDEVERIYESLYWRPAGLSGVANIKTAALIFDQVVNRGPVAALKTVQEVLDQKFDASLILDGKLGAKTLEALNSADQWKFCLQFVIATQAFYVDLVKKDPTQMVFLNGWFRRTWRLLEILV